MKFQLLSAAFLTLTVATPSVHAGPVFSFQAAPTPGAGGIYANVYYGGLNDFNGTIAAGPPSYGILGVGTPTNSGKALFESNVTFSVFGNSGSFEINSLSADFTGTVVTSSVSSTGGTFVVDGYLGDSAAAYFGLSAGTQMVGTAAIQLTPDSLSRGPANELGYLQFTFSPAPFSTPEPSSVVLLGTGVLGLMAVLHRRSRRA